PNSARPDDQKHREAEIDVQHHKSKRQLAEIVLLRHPHHRLHRLIPRQQNRRQNSQRQNPVSLGHQKLQSPNRRVPRDIKRLDPIDRTHGEQDNINKDADTAQILKLDAPAVVTRLSPSLRVSITLERPLIQEVLEYPKNPED